eukprot:TRINITY_DN49339_c0_g1_i1.p1 TRINITY_DN49339_c0_g1~~TRINITY_DN49339_c0_g1_i1.p1  ORF type:complete len:1127 (+),score=142.92 TRINITY_DN49339_c0_g1_i1:116-3496(+)
MSAETDHSENGNVFLRKGYTAGTNILVSSPGASIVDDVGTNCVATADVVSRTINGSLSYYPPLRRPSGGTGIAMRQTEAHDGGAQRQSAYGVGGRTLAVKPSPSTVASSSLQGSRRRLSSPELALRRQRGREIQAELVGQVTSTAVLRVAAEAEASGELGTTHTVTALHRAARFSCGSRDGNARSDAGLPDDVRWCALVSRASAAARNNQLSPMSLVLTAWSLAVAKHWDQPALEAISQTIAERREECKPHDMSGVAWAFAALDVVNGSSGGSGGGNIIAGAGPLFTAIAPLAAARTEEFLPQDLSMIVWAFARVAWRDTVPLFDAVAASATERHAEFAGQNLSNTLWAFGATAHVNEPLFNCMATSGRTRLVELQAVEVSTLLWSCASVMHSDPFLFLSSTARVQRLASKLESQQLTSIAWAFARSAVRDKQLFTCVSAEVVSRKLPLVPSEINRLAWAFAFPGKPAEERTGRAGGFRDPALLAHLAAQAKLRLSELDALQSSSIAWAFATLTYSDTALFESMSARFASNDGRLIAGCDAQNIAYLMWAFARLEVANADLANCACEEALRRGLADFDHRHLSMLLWALARTGQRHEGFWAAVRAHVPGTYANELGDPQGVAALAMVIHALNKLGEHSTSTELMDRVFDVNVDVSGDAYGGWLAGCRERGDIDTELRVWEQMARSAPSRGMRAIAGNMAAIRALESVSHGHGRDSFFSVSEAASTTAAVAVARRRASATLDLLDNEQLTTAVSLLIRKRCQTLDASSASAIGVVSDVVDEEPSPPCHALGWQPRNRSEGIRQARAAGRILCKWDYYKEVGVLEYVLTRASPGDTESVCAAIEAFSREEHLYLKLGAEEKGLALDAMLAEVEEGLLARPSPPPLVVEIGCYVGYSATRMGRRLADWPGGRLVTIEVDPYHAAVSRSILELAGLGDVVQVWIGHSENLIPRLLPRFGTGCVRAIFFDQKGTRYHDDLELLEAGGLLANGALVCADNVVRPGAPQFMWRVCDPHGVYETQAIAHRDYGQDSVEDWLSISRFNATIAAKEDPIRRGWCPQFLIQLAYESDQIRNRSVNERVTEEEWRIFAVRVCEEFKAAGIEPTILRPQFSKGGLCVELLPWSGSDVAE